MEPRVSIITLGVRDLSRSLAFYRDGLGLPTTWTVDKDVIFFQTSGVCLALYSLSELAKDVHPDSPATAPATERTPFNGIALAHNVRRREEVDEVLALAARSGGRIERPAHEAFWGGYSGYFSDPDGYLWEVAWGAFDFNADGSLAIT